MSASIKGIVATLPVVALLCAVEVSAQDTSIGYPIDDATVVAECSSCHAQDEEGRLSRISWMRKTPEGWQTSLQRMVALHGVSVSPEAARRIVRYLADEQGLAPEELRPGLFEVERRPWTTIDYEYADSDVEQTCLTCHSMGRVITQRRTTEEWGLLLTTHRALYPLVDWQAFRRSGDEGEHPMDVAIEHLGETFPLRTPEWSAWSATMRSPRLAGEWALTGHEPGKGAIFGRVSVVASPADPDAFTTRASYVYAETGVRVERSGQALVYTGYQWRGRSNPGQGSEFRQVMFVERDLQSIHGRWFTGAYDELGAEVTLRRIGPGAVVSGVHPKALMHGGTSTVTVYGANLDAAGDDLDLGAGVSLQSIESRGAESMRVRLAVAPEAQVGPRDLYAGGTVLAGAVVVHDGVDRIEVTPRAGMARVGGASFPKELQTFDAIGYDDGPDGEPGTEDDLVLGRVEATWRLEEYAATYGDDDIRFVGRILQDGTFEPNLDGPNPERSGNRNNVGDVWVVATHTDGTGRQLSARAHLIVTVPLYMRFNPWPSPGDEPRPVGDEP
ncbi:MAG TPA: quinohemoprotein amine dehydrogenase subunit alpha [Longimicrobiales bacterium]|nr:quinohemoprotein amine dehydrogenase subunit alpha [Longimicrobiales bacterium]